MKVTISCHISRNYGVENVNFGASYEVEVSSIEERDMLYTRLYESVALQHKNYAARNLPNVPNSQQQASQQENVVVIPVVKISTELKDGKLYYKAHGGQFIKWGVRIWDDVLTQAGIESIPLEGLTLQGYTGKVLIQNGRGKKLLSLVKSQ